MPSLDPDRFATIRAYYAANPPPRPAPDHVERMGRPSNGRLSRLLGARTLTWLAQEAAVPLTVVSGLNTGRLAWTVPLAERIALALDLDHPARLMFPDTEVRLGGEYVTPCITPAQARDLEARGCGPAHLLLWPELRV